MSDAFVWTVIATLGAGTYATRFAFLGLIGDRKLPDWALRHLRYVGVAVLPGLVAPLVVWPQANDGATDPLRLVAAATALGVGAWRRDAIAAIVAGAAVLAIGSWALA
jgi:branched-subunit amino acid transport protein